MNFDNLVSQAEGLLKSKLTGALTQPLDVGVRALASAGTSLPQIKDIGIRALTGVNLPTLTSVGNVSAALSNLGLPSPSGLARNIFGQAQSAINAFTAPLQNIAAQAQAQGALSNARGSLKSPGVTFIGSDFAGNLFGGAADISNISDLAADNISTVATFRPLRLLASPVQSIGEIYADVVISEQHSDQLVMTEHPVEQGSQVTDHSYLLPSEVTLELGWSNSSEFAEGDANYAYNQYQRLRALRESRVPFEVYTGKNYYPKMLLVDLRNETTQETEFSLIATLRCRELIAAVVSATTLPPTSQQAIPSKTASVVDNGPQTAAPATASPNGVSGDLIGKLVGGVF